MKYRIYTTNDTWRDFESQDDLWVIWLNLNEPYVKLCSLDEDGEEIETFTPNQV